MKELQDTILDPSSQTEGLAAAAPRACRAVTLLLPPVLFQAGTGMTPQLQAGNYSVDKVAVLFSGIPGSGRKTNDSKMQEER